MSALRPASTIRQQQGMAMLVMALLMVVAGLLAQQIASARRNDEQRENQRLARQTQTLANIQESLLAFASQQGYNSLSQQGHLPCPAILPGGIPQTTCLTNPTGYLPAQSVAKTNYLNPNVSAQWDYSKNQLDKDWAYAVSTQLIQPNQLGWSRWVDFSKPALKVRTVHDMQNNVAALVAGSIQIEADGTLDPSSPALVLTVTQLQKHIEKTQAQTIINTTQTWLRAIHSAPFAHEYLQAIAAGPQTETSLGFQSLQNTCACECSKTRCTCTCEETQGWWASSSACYGNNPQCKAIGQWEEAQLPDWAITISKPNSFVCKSSSAQSCVFQGPAHLLSQWPIARFEPVASAGRPCQPTTANICPLSKTGSNCTCQFGWPAAINLIAHTPKIVFEQIDNEPTYRARVQFETF